MDEFGMSGWTADQEEEYTGFQMIPKAWYKAIIQKAEKRDTNGAAGPGKMLSLTIQIVEGPFSGRLIWKNLCLQNPNEKTQQIARQQWGAICRSCGRIAPKDYEYDLLNIPLGVFIAPKKQRDGEMKEEVSAFCTEVELSKKQQAQPAAPAANPLGGASYTPPPAAPAAQTPPPAPPAFQMQPPQATGPDGGFDTGETQTY